MNKFVTPHAAECTPKARSCARSLLFLCIAVPLSAHAAQMQSRPDPPATARPAPAASPAPQQARIQADTERLDRLVRELQEEIARSDQNTLSLSLVKKADEIEKLAHSLKKSLRQN